MRLNQLQIIFKLRFGFLEKLAKPVLSHSNADPERLFSMEQKIETEHRPRLASDTVGDLLSCKINNDTTCYENQHITNKSLLKSAKTATMRSLV